MKIPEFKRSRIGLIVEFSGIPNGFPNQGYMDIEDYMLLPLIFLFQMAFTFKTLMGLAICTLPETVVIQIVPMCFACTPYSLVLI